MSTLIAPVESRPVLKTYITLHRRQEDPGRAHHHVPQVVEGTRDLPQDRCVSPVEVGLFVDSFTPIMDGVTVAVRNCAYWLDRTLGPTCVVTPRVPAHSDNEGFGVVRFLSIPTIVRPPYRIGLPNLDPGLRATLRRRDFSIVHAHSPFSAGRTALRIARERGVPVVATFHSKFRENLRRVLPFKRIVQDEVKRIVELLYSVDRVWIPQESVAATLREYGYQGACEVVENGTDLTPPPCTRPYRHRGGTHLGIPQDARVGLYVGQLVVEKNLEFLLRSLPHVLARVPSFHMVLVGQGCAKGRLHRLSQELGIGDRVIFHDVVFDRELLKAIYARADLFLFPSLYDNAPLVVRESAAFATPSVLLRGCTAAEVIRDNQNGFLAEGDTEAFAARVVEVIQDPELLKRVGEGAQRTLCRSWEDVAGEIRRKYLAILSQWRR
jgi:1,2-diacylglycerol 3-alpha-glucosyltransferase